MAQCDCGSGQDFSRCCGPFLSGVSEAPSAQALMRSRYSAYVRANVDYIESTMRGAASESFNADEVLHFAKRVHWLGLTVLTCKNIGEQEATVIFFARYRNQGKNEYIYERSMFENKRGKWYYVSGQHLKISRNENCPCGSGKKFKRCCIHD